MTTPVLAPTTDVDIDALVYDEDDEDDNITHYVHLECQPSQTFVTAMCGFVMPVEELLPDEAPTPYPCKDCVDVWLTTKCPVCGR